MTSHLKLNERCILYPYDGGSDAEEFILLTPKGQRFRISKLAKEILQSLDGSTSIDLITQRFQVRNIDISAAQLHAFLEQEYGFMGIFDNYSPPSTSPQLRQKTPLPIFLHWGVIPVRLTGRVAKIFAWLLSRFMVLAGVVTICICHYWIYRVRMPAVIDDETTVNVLIVTLLVLASALFHEFGHASAVTRYGGTPGPIGLGLYALLPAFYADVSEIWRFRRRHRMVVDCAGVYFQQLVFCIFALLSYTTGAAEFTVACAVIDNLVLLNLNPIFQFDGYWLLVDFLSLPNLHQLAWMQIKKWLGLSREAPDLPIMRKHVYLIFIAYVISSVAFIAILIRVEYRYLLHPSARFFANLPKLLASLMVAFKTWEPLKLGGYLLRIAFIIAIPLSAMLGMGIYGLRVYRYFAQKARSL